MAAAKLDASMKTWGRYILFQTVKKTFFLWIKRYRRSFCSQCIFTLKSPGPAAYNVVDPSVYRQKPPQYSMYGRNATLGGRTQTPGPGAHFPEKVLILSYFITTKGTNVLHHVLSLTVHVCLPRWPSQKQKLQASPLDCATHNLLCSQLIDR